MQAPKFTFNVSVNTINGNYIITNENGSPAVSPIIVNVSGTMISYNLIGDNEDLIFIAPQISDDPAGDLTFDIKNNGRNITLTDNDANNELICVKLVTQLGERTFVSPDPQVKNRPE